MKWFKGFKTSLERSSIHGLKYTVKNNYHWTERSTWIILCAISWCMCIVTICNIYRNFEEKSVAVTVDTNYLDWSTPFPTIAICSTYNDVAKMYMRSLLKGWGMRRGITFSGNTYQWTEQLFLPFRMGYLPIVEQFDLPAEDLIEMYEMAKPNCLNTFNYCEWNGLRFDCCNEFAALHTSIGYCLMINSKHVKPNNPSIDFNVNRSQPYAYLAFDLTDNYKETNYNIQIFILNNIEIPTISTSKSKILKNLEKIKGVDFHVQDIFNEDGVRNIPEDKRKCRFPEENKDSIIYDLYSFDGCTTDIYATRMIDACGCIGYAYPRERGLEVCNMTGMRCVSEFWRNLPIESDSRDELGCLPDCEGVTIDWYAHDWHTGERTRDSGLRFKMLSRPHLRYHRYVVRSLFDVMVSSGQSIGLFTGASILSIVELFFWILIRRQKSK